MKPLTPLEIIKILDYIDCRQTGWLIDLVKAVEKHHGISEINQPPPECVTEGEKLAYSFGWWKAMETKNEKA